MTDPTPTAPDWRALLEEMTQSLSLLDKPPHDLLAKAQAFLAATTDRTRLVISLATPLPPSPEPRGCPTPGACSCPTAPIVPPELIRALELAEAALADIGDADREPGDDIAWAERRAAQDLPRIRHALQMWRDHATPPAATREAGPLPQTGAVSERLLGVAVDGVPCDFIRTLLRPAYEPGDGSADGAQLVSQAWWHPIMGCDSLQIVVDNARAALARWGGAAVSAATRKAGPLPQEGAEISDEEIDQLEASMWKATGVHEQGQLEQIFNYRAFARAVLSRWGGAAVQAVPVAFIHRQGSHWEVSERSLDEQEKACGWTQEPLYDATTAVQPVPVSERPWERPGWCDAEGYCWAGYPSETENLCTSHPQWLLTNPTYIDSRKDSSADSVVLLPHWALPVPAAAAGEGRDDG